MPVVIATITPKPDQIDAVEAALKELIPSVHEEDGCELYALHRSRDRFVFVEKWRDMDALGVHGSGPNVKALNAKLEGLTAAATEVQVLRALPAGDGAKGAV